MKFFHMIKATLAHSIILALAALVSAGGLTQARECRWNSAMTACAETNNSNPLIPHDEPKEDKTKENEQRKRLALIPAYVLATGIFLVFIPWLLWRLTRNQRHWKIHTPSPRPQYIRDSFRWVDVDTWKQKEAEKARHKECEQHPIYRTTKANYKWIFHDPTGELQQRFDQQKERSHLRFLPSWMRSYPLGTMQSGIPAQQSKASKEVCQLPQLHVNENSCHSNRGFFGGLQMDGSPMSGALRDPHYQLPNLSKMDDHDPMTPNTSGKAYSLPILPVMDGPDVTQVWFIRDDVLRPERRDIPRLETEEEQRGETDSAEEVMRRDTEHRLEVGRRRLANADAQFNAASDAMVRPYVEHLENQRSVMEDQLDGVRAVRIPRQTRHVHRTNIRELHQFLAMTYPPPPPLPPIRRHAIELQQSIAALEARIQRLREDPEDIPLHDNLDSLMSKLRRAQLEWDRLPPMPDLPPPVLPSQRRLRLHQIFRRTDPDDALPPRPRVFPGYGIIDNLPGAPGDTMTVADDNLVSDRRRGLDSCDIRAVQTPATRGRSFSAPSRGHARRQVSSSTPTIVTPRTHRESSHAVIEDVAMLDKTDSSGPVAGDGVDDGGNCAVSEGTSANDSSDHNPTPAAAAPPHSPSQHDDADLKQSDPVVQPSHLYYECTAWGNYFAAERERSDTTPAPDTDSRDDEIYFDAAPVLDGDDEGPSSSAAARGSESREPFEMEMDERLEEELYGDGY